MGSQISILRELDLDEVARRRGEGEFFWADLDLAGGTTVERVAAAFGLGDDSAGVLGDFDPAPGHARRVHVEEDLIVFRAWCVANPDAGVLGGMDALEPFQVNIALHADYLLTVHDYAFDIPGAVTEGRLPPGRDERYAVYVALDGIAGTVLEALANTEEQVGDLEAGLLRPGLRPRTSEHAKIASLRERLTGLRMKIGPQRALFERIGEEIEHVRGLEGDRSTSFERIETQLDRGLDRLNAANQALSHAFDIELNAITNRLTVVATIFLPLTFLVGFFGMNFGWMVREIDSKGDFVVLGILIWLVPLALAGLYFAARGLLRRGRPG